MAREPLIPSPLPHSFTIVDTSCLSPWERRERHSGQSYVNRAEANIISAIVAAEDGRGRDWAVAVPYTAQVSLIRRQLLQTLGSAGGIRDLELRVGTIDSFMGREHDLVIVGCTRSNDRRSVGFLQELRRFNVAMTRARRQLVVVGDMEALKSARERPVRELMNAMFEHVRGRGEIVRADTITEQYERWHVRDCARCGRRAALAANWEGPLCRTCYDQAVRSYGRCAGCGAERCCRAAAATGRPPAGTAPTSPVTSFAPAAASRAFCWAGWVSRFRLQFR